MHPSSAAIDDFSYGDLYNLSAENFYLADSLIAQIAIGVLGQRSSLKSAQGLLRRKFECGV